MGHPSLAVDTMRDPVRFALALIAGLVAVVATVVVTLIAPPPSVSPLAVMAFAALIVFATMNAIRIGGGEVSFMPMAVAAAYLVLGLPVAGWTVILAELIHAGLRRIRVRIAPDAREPQGRDLAEVTAMNLAMHGLGVLAGGSVFEILGGRVPLVTMPPSYVLPLLAAAVTYLGGNYVLASGYLALRGRAAWRDYRSSLSRLLLYEGGPLVFAPLLAVVTTRLGWGYFALFSLAFVLSSLLSRNLALASQRLRRRLREISSLEAVGQALSSSLDVEEVLSAVYEQVVNLMPAPSFYIALYDFTTDEVSFPLIVTGGEPGQGRTRRARRGLTEYVLETAQPLLIPRDVEQHVAALGLEHIGRQAACWLGVPIVARGVAFGVMAVQSYDTPEAYDERHVEVLETIAVQAAIAIQNARLYERTDEALARRVQELDSVLRTTREGVLLLDLEWRILAANRALAEFVAMTQSDLVRHPIDALRTDGEPLITLIAYTPNALRKDCARLQDGEATQLQDVVILEPLGRHVARTLTPVRDAKGKITGWLVVLRDLTEEIALDRLREDMTHMLVHDLRSPASLVTASLSMLSDADEQVEPDQVARLVEIARRGIDRILGLIDQLLDIGQLERGQLPLDQETIAVGDLFREVAARYAPVATANEISLRYSAEGEMPLLYVDRSLVSRVLSNLVDNALKFTPDGGEVTLWARAGGTTAPGFLLIGVQDTGPGIPAEAHAQLFEKFEQVPGIHGRRRGTGLGLPFCKLAVEAHSGEIWVESMVGEGTTFLLTLPSERASD
jgi:signal transduction histidine kinase